MPQSIKAVICLFWLMCHRSSIITLNTESVLRIVVNHSWPEDNQITSKEANYLCVLFLGFFGLFCFFLILVFDGIYQSKYITFEIKSHCLSTLNYWSFITGLRSIKYTQGQDTLKNPTCFTLQQLYWSSGRHKKVRDTQQIIVVHRTEFSVSLHRCYLGNWHSCVLITDMLLPYAIILLWNKKKE